MQTERPQREAQRHGALSGAPRAARGSRLIPFTCATTAFAIMAALYMAAPFPVYAWILKTWGIHPFRFVFLDTDTVLSAVRCLRNGVDVFVANPCDVLGRVFDYSPLWLLLAKLPEPMTRLVPSGLLVDAAYLFSLLLLPAAASRRDSWLIALGAVSTAAVFAVERANNDLLLFALAALAAVLACRSPAWRLVGYGAVLLAGMLKYYPMATLAIATRERPARFLFVIVLAGIAAALFLLTMGHDLTRALKLIPTGDWFGDMFGSSTVAGGIAQIIGLPAPARTALQATMCLSALLVAIRLATTPAITGALIGLGERERAFLLVGAFLILGCFFTAQNIGYRAIHLLLVLPAMLALARTGGGHRLLRWSPRIVLLLLWAEGWRNAVQQLEFVFDGTIVRQASWAVREALWWGLIPLLIACVTILLLNSEMGLRLFKQRGPAFRQAAGA